MKKRREKWIDYFDLIEAFKIPGCPLCNRSRDLSCKFLDNLFYERVTDDGTRVGLRKSKGFCNWHAWMSAEINNSNSGIAIIYKDLLDAEIEQLRKWVKGKDRLKRVNFGRKKNRHALLSTWVGKSPCPICSDEYFATIENHLRELKFREGVLISAELGKGNKGANYILRKSQEKKQSWIERIFAKKPPVYTYHLHPRDESGARALSELRDKGINLVANTLAQSTDHILSFFSMLQIELAFYVGCLNLHEQLAQMGEPMSFPVPVAPCEHRHSFCGLTDVCLALTMKQKIVGNDVNVDGNNLVIITGANQGGKSTFLRSIGLAQLMMQCGMLVPAESFSSNVCDGLFTHYKREEDTTMKSGKLDEELSRMSDIVDQITLNSMVLFNESFAATNEREGSEIARQIIRVLLEKHLKIFYVTHLYEFAHGFVDKKTERAVFLRAERQADGGRTFKLVEGQPLQTSYGEDLYNSIFVGRDITMVGEG